MLKVEVVGDIVTLKCQAVALATPLLIWIFKLLRPFHRWHISKKIGVKKIKQSPCGNHLNSVLYCDLSLSYHHIISVTTTVLQHPSHLDCNDRLLLEVFCVVQMAATLYFHCKYFINRWKIQGQCVSQKLYRIYKVSEDAMCCVSN